MQQLNLFDIEDIASIKKVKGRVLVISKDNLDYRQNEKFDKLFKSFENKNIVGFKYKNITDEISKAGNIEKLKEIDKFKTGYFVWFGRQRYYVKPNDYSEFKLKIIKILDN